MSLLRGVSFMLSVLYVTVHGARSGYYSQPSAQGFAPSGATIAAATEVPEEAAETAKETEEEEEEEEKEIPIRADEDAESAEEEKKAEEAAEAAKKADDVKKAEEAAEAAKKAKAKEAIEAAKTAEEEIKAEEAAAAAKNADEEKEAEEAAEAARKAEEEKKANEAIEAAKKAEEAAAAAKKADEEKKAKEAAEGAAKLEEEKKAKEAIEAAKKAEEDKKAREAAEATKKADADKKAKEAAEAAKKAEEERAAKEAESLLKGMSTAADGPAKALIDALMVVGESKSEGLRKLVDSFQPVYMLAGGTSQAKDALMMMLMGLPFAFQGAGIATRAPCLYRTFPSTDGKTSVKMRLRAGEEAVEVEPKDVVSKIGERMRELGNTFSGETVDITVSCPTCRQSLYKNMMGRVVTDGKEDIDSIYKVHASPRNTVLVAVERSDTLPANSMVAPFVAEFDPKGSRTIFVKTWADYGIHQITARSGVTCAEAQQYFKELDFKKEAGNNAPTFWIATVKEGAYVTDSSLTFEKRTVALEKAIAAQEAKMQEFIDDWSKSKQGCTFDFADNIYVTRLREHLSEVHQRTIFNRLPEIVGALKTEIRRMSALRDADEKKLGKMNGQGSAVQELLGVVTHAVHVYDNQWTGDNLPTSELPKAQVDAIQAKYFNMTAPEFAKQLVASWQEEGPQEYQDKAFDDRLIEMANMLSYSASDQSLTYSAHFWSHLTNMYMLLVRSIKDLLEARDPSKMSNIGAVGRAGSSECNAAIVEAKYAFREGGSKRGLRLMQYGVRFLLTKHVEAALDIFQQIPSLRPYAEDKRLMAKIRAALMELVDEGSERFRDEFFKFLYMVTTNVQQGKVFRMLNTMTEERDEKGQAEKISGVRIASCQDVPGAQGSRHSKFPMCKCVDNKASVFCGSQQLVDSGGDFIRKFNATAVKEMDACKYASPYCSKAATEHRLLDLAKVLNPNPENCETLYDELVDSSIDILVNNVGSLMYYLAYDAPDSPLVKRRDLPNTIINILKGSSLFNDRAMMSKYSSLGQYQELAEKVKKQKEDINDMERTLEKFLIAQERALDEK